MFRTIVAVIAGYGLWTLVFLFGNNLLFKEAVEISSAGGIIDDRGTLIGILLLSVLASFAAGWITVIVGHSLKTVWIMAFCLLVTGITIQTSSWALMPVWYHLSFLGLLVPVSIFGGKAVRAR